MTGQGRMDQQWTGQPPAARSGATAGGRPARYGMGQPGAAYPQGAPGAGGSAPRGYDAAQTGQGGFGGGAGYAGAEYSGMPSSAANVGIGTASGVSAGMNAEPGAVPSARISQGVGMPALGYAPQGYAHPTGAGVAGAYVPPRTSQPAPPPKKKRGAGFWIGIVVALIAIIVAILLALTFCTDQKKDRSGDLGQLEGKSAGEIQAELDRVVEEGMFNISIASVVEMTDGTSPAELRIENVPNNNYLMQVTITREDTGEVLYESGVIEQNHHIQADTLDVDLPAGSYDCLATFTALDPETEDPIGEAAASMKINVLG